MWAKSSPRALFGESSKVAPDALRLGFSAPSSSNMVRPGWAGGRRPSDGRPRGRGAAGGKGSKALGGGLRVVGTAELARSAYAAVRQHLPHRAPVAHLLASRGVLRRAPLSSPIDCSLYSYLPSIQIHWPLHMHMLCRLCWRGAISFPTHQQIESESGGSRKNSVLKAWLALHVHVRVLSAHRPCYRPRPPARSSTSTIINNNKPFGVGLPPSIWRMGLPRGT
jgi:hypothetical protein